MGIPTTLLTSWETYMQVKKQQLELDMEQQTGSKLGKEYVKAVYCHPAYLTSMQSISWEMPGWMKHKLESRLPGEISIISDNLRWHHPCGRKWRGAKEPLDESERGEWKSWLESRHSKMKIMESSPITSWQIDGETMAAVTDLIFLGSKITADGDCSHEVKRCLLLGRKAMTNLKVKVKVTQSCHTLATPWTIRSMEFSRSEYWSGQPFPSPGIKSRSPAL